VVVGISLAGTDVIRGERILSRLPRRVGHPAQLLIGGIGP
jgi:hypothetical protein